MNFYLATISNDGNKHFYLLKTEKNIQDARELFILDKFHPDDDYFQNVPCDDENLDVDDLFLLEIRSMEKIHVSFNDESFPENFVGFTIDVSFQNISEEEFKTLQKTCEVHDIS